MAVAETFSGVHQRRYDLDWLRVIAFGLLIFYHVGMFYVSWPWHVKSAYAGPAAEPLMLIVNPWRLALLFFISGVAVRFATDKTPGRLAFARSRLYRLGLPILAGMTVLVAPQTYYELRQAGAIDPGYLAFWGNYLKLEQLYPMITPTWNHLWYVVYLLVYVLLIAPFLPAMRRLADGRGGRWLGAMSGGPVRLLLIFIVPFVTYEALLSPHFPTTHNLVWDWANHAHRLTIFLLGYFAAKNDRFWAGVDRALPYAAGAALILITGRLHLRAWHWDYYVSVIDGPVATVLLTLFAWSFIVTLLGLGQRFLNRPSKALTYLTGAVFCYYILHQTIIVVAGYYLTQLKLGVWPEFLIMTVLTVAGGVVGYELVRRVPGLRVFFGVKSAPPSGMRIAARAAA